MRIGGAAQQERLREQREFDHAANDVLANAAHDSQTKTLLTEELKRDRLRLRPALTLSEVRTAVSRSSTGGRLRVMRVPFAEYCGVTTTHWSTMAPPSLTRSTDELVQRFDKVCRAPPSQAPKHNHVHRL